MQGAWKLCEVLGSIGSSDTGMGMEHLPIGTEGRTRRWSQRRALIKVGYSCNDHCVFCHTDDYRHSGDAATGALYAKIDEAARRGFDMVVFSGGEATMRRDLFRLARRVRHNRMKLGFVTNGRVLSYPEVVERLVSEGLEYVHLSIHGPERIHNKLTGDKSFAQSYAGLRNLNGRGLDLTVNCVVTKQNMDSLRDFIDLMKPLEDVVVKFSACEPKGAALRNWDQVIPPLDRSAEAVVDALSYGEKVLRGKGIRLAIENFPYCLVPEYRHLDDDLEANRLLVMSEVWDSDLVVIDDFNKVKGPACAGCRESQDCPGVFVESMHRFGGGVLQPFTEDLETGGVPKPQNFQPPEQARIDSHPGFPDMAMLTLIVPECDRSCHFCDLGQEGMSNREVGRPSTLEGASAALRAHRGHFTELMISGGEPTRLSWLPELLRRAHAWGFEHIWMQTHGGAFSSIRYARELKRAGLSGIDVPLYGTQDEIHDSITCTEGSWRESLKGIRVFQGLGGKVTVHTTLFESNEEDSVKWVQFARAIGADGGYAQLVGERGTCKAGVETQLNHGAELLQGLILDAEDWPFRISGMPPCLSGETETSPQGIPLLPFDEWMWVFTGGESRGFADSCVSCTLKPRCQGLERKPDGTLVWESQIEPKKEWSNAF